MQYGNTFKNIRFDGCIIINSLLFHCFLHIHTYDSYLNNRWMVTRGMGYRCDL